jgi:ABC-type uncharacterized transport system ATPase subunit
LYHIRQYTSQWNFNLKRLRQFARFFSCCHQPERSRTLCAEESLTKLQTYGEVGSVEGCVVRFLIHREDLTQTVARIVAELDVVDLTVTDPPVEEVIGCVFQAGAVT